MCASFSNCPRRSCASVVDDRAARTRSVGAIDLGLNRRGLPCGATRKKRKSAYILAPSAEGALSQATWKKTSTALTPRVVRLLREAALYLLAAVGVYLLLSLWTYQSSDPSWSHRGPSAAVANMGGRVGAWSADVLFNLFGYAAFLFPVMIAIGGWRIYVHRDAAQTFAARLENTPAPFIFNKC